MGAQVHPTGPTGPLRASDLLDMVRQCLWTGFLELRRRLTSSTRSGSIVSLDVGNLVENKGFLECLVPACAGAGLARIVGALAGCDKV